MSIELDWTRLDAIFQPRQDILDGIKRCAGRGAPYKLKTTTYFILNCFLQKRPERLLFSTKSRLIYTTSCKEAESPTRSEERCKRLAPTVRLHRQSEMQLTSKFYWRLGRFPSLFHSAKSLNCALRKISYMLAHGEQKRLSTA